MDKSFRIVWILIISILIVNLIDIGLNAYNSYKLDCSGQTITEIKNNSNIQINGYFDSVNNCVVVLNENKETKDSTLKHEICHQIQNSKKILVSCEEPIKVYINEFECYSMEKLPNKLFNLII